MFDLIENNLLFFAALTFATISLIWLGWKIRLWWKNFLFMMVRKRGKKGERNAIKLLQRNGYEILDAQVRLTGHFFVDGKLTEFDLRPDFLVERSGYRYIAEIKTGEASNPKNRNTRRQLHEYSHYSGMDSVLLVDPTKKSIQLVVFRKTI